MNNVTSMLIHTAAEDIYEAFVDPERIGGFWFSSSSRRWEQGATVTLRYDEYNAEGKIEIIELAPSERIVFQWGEGHTVTITFRDSESDGTIVSVTEEGFDPSNPDLLTQMLDNKEGWVYMLTCLKGYLEHGANLRAALVKG